MRFLFGTKRYLLKSYHQQAVACDACGDQPHRVDVCQNHYHLFGIPIKTAGPRFVENTCSKCRRVQESSSYPLLSGLRKPLRFYALPIVIVLMIFALLLGNIVMEGLDADYVYDPKAGDVYLMGDGKKSQRGYYFFKVTDVHASSDVVEILCGAYLYTSFVSEMDPTDYFDKTDKRRFTREDLKKLWQDGYILSVKRNYGQGSRFHIVK